jgi:ribosomal protein S12 methylthiotransferase accessory factor
MPGVQPRRRATPRECGRFFTSVPDGGVRAEDAAILDDVKNPAGAPVIAWSHDRVAVVASGDEDVVWLLGGHEPVRLSGRLATTIAPEVDGTRTRAEVIDAAALRGVSHFEAHVALESWMDSGLLCVRPTPPAPMRILGPHARELASAAEVAGLEVVGDAGLEIRILDDLLDLSAMGDDVDAGREWLPVQVRGPRVIVGPMMGPSGCCSQCLIARLERRRAVDLAAARLAGVDRPPLGRLHPMAATVAAGAIGAFLAGGIGSDRERARTLVTVDVATLARDIHTVIPVPGCPACDPDGASLLPTPRGDLDPARAHRSADPDVMWNAYQDVVGDLVGVIPGVFPQDPPDLHVFHAGANPVVSQASDLQDVRASLRAHAGGKGITAAGARAGALAEAIERQSMLWRGDEPTVRARLDELPGALHPNDVQLFSDRQLVEADERYREFGAPSRLDQTSFHLVPRAFDVAGECDWTRLESLTGQAPIWMPSSTVWLSHPETSGGRFRACSNGVAAGFTHEEALLHGLLELIERDAVGLWWYSRSARPGVDVDASPDPRVHAALAPLRRLGRDVWVLDITTDIGVPVMAALSSSPDGANIAYAFGAHVDPVVAVVRALTEVAQMESGRLWMEGRAITPPEMEARWWAEVTTASDPWLRPHGHVALHVEERVQDPLGHVLQRLSAVGLAAYWVDLTRRDLRLPVVRVVVPGLRHFWNRFAPGRLYDVPPALGWTSAGYAEADLNPRWVFI